MATRRNSISMNSKLLAAMALVAVCLPLLALARTDIADATVSHSGRHLLMTPPPQPDGATYLGCYVTSTSAPLLPVWLFVNNWGAVFDYQKCVNIARSMGFKYVGFEYGTKCEAGMDNSRFVNQVGNDTGCVAPCDFNSGRNHQPTYACGGTNRVTLFEVIPSDCSANVTSEDYLPPIIKYHDVYIKDNSTYYTTDTHNGVVSSWRVASYIVQFMQAWDLGTGTPVIMTSSLKCSATTPDGVVHPYGGALLWSPVGINTYTCTATDAAGNTASKSITVNVVAGTAPTTTTTTAAATTASTDDPAINSDAILEMRAANMKRKRRAGRAANP